MDYTSTHSPLISPMPSYRKLQRKNGIYYLSIPPNLVKALQAHPGDFFELQVNADYSIALRHVSQTDSITNLNLQSNEIKYVRE
jgi:antitoxin component of MazEF toxin-antitoxin module